MTKITYISIIPVLAILLAGCGSSEKHQLAETKPIAVEVGTVKSLGEAQTIQVSGRIEAVSSANISTRMMGNISGMMVKPGDKVNKGDLLVVISSADLRAKKAQVQSSIVQAESGLENAKKDYERFQVLYKKGSASKKELENMTTRYEMAQAGLEAARQMEKEVEAQFAYTNLRAPFSGVVTNTFVKEGDIANPGMPLATVEGTSAYEAAVMVPESQISKVKSGAFASVLVKSKNLSLEGVVKEVSLSAKNTGGQYLVKIDLKEAKDILPGMFINASIATGQKSGNTSPVVSENALVRNGQLTGVYTVGEENTAILRWVRTGQSKDGQVEILSGVKDGEQYIMKPEGKLYNGAKITVNN
ncbi:efflux RND transporter periplasmic adaptor subunit [Ekhidna sp.]|jgi:RND family efflux transporter MFP subunit|uniref:efflux RND transporter periplasmic adaptor subunit n=1 Tax=Ekhidna sp. TaxID=2608089 RepID=UPI0032EF1F05